MKKIICLMLILSMVLCCFSTNVFAEDINFLIRKKSTNKTENYIIKAHTKGRYDKIKNELKKQGKIRVNHKEKDENYLTDLQSMVVEISEKEAQKYKEDNELTVEKDYIVSASEKKTQVNNVPDNIISKNIDIKLNFNAVEPIQLNTIQYEYSDDPENFIPCEAVTDSDKINEVVPWNIACVANTPSKNQYKGKNIKIAVIDSGIDTHNDLNTVKWVDFSDTVLGYKPIDNSGHGTSVAGVIAARINGFGMEGIASEAELYSLKILNEDNTASTSTVVKAIEWCIENDIDIINMSFGMDHFSSIMADEISKAYDAGILMISAAGNNVDKIQYPANYPEVISVGSINKKLTSSEFSNNTYVDLVAPGEEAQTTGYLGSFCITSGTSIAAAHVTGVAAAVKSANNSIKNYELKEILLNSALVLDDGSRLINYSEAINYLFSSRDKKVMPSDIKEEVMEKGDNENYYVKGSWSSEAWLGKDESLGTGHYSLMNKLSISYFGNDYESDTEKTNNRTIAADAARRIDLLEWTSSTHDLGNAPRNIKGYIDTSLSGHCYAPYHAKAQYDMNEILNQMFFLYELARRRLVLGSNLSLDPLSYSGDKYYSVYIGEKMKRRIIVDLSAMYEHQSIIFGGSINMNTVRHKGYMVLGVFLHLVQDIQAHRAKVTHNMLFDKADGTVYYGYDNMADSAADSKICGANIIGVSSGNYDKYWELYNKIHSDGSIPMNKLKTFLNNNGIPHTCTRAQAYEDNPNFYRDRYTSAHNFTWAYINRMYNDTGNTSSQLTTYYATDSVPLYMNKY